jgi:hypothetical protein
MNFSKSFLILVVAFSIGLLSFKLPSNLQKKITKEIKITFSIEKYELDEVAVSDSVNVLLKNKIQKNKLFKILLSKELVGYAFIDKAPSKTDEFDFLILFDADLIVKKAKVLIYREDYGGEIGSKRWLKQFIGKKGNDILVYEKDIIAISGATISAYSMTVGVNKLLHTVSELQKHKVL